MTPDSHRPPTPPACSCKRDTLPLAERRRLAAQRQDELADILAGAVFDLFLRRLQDKHRGSESGKNHESTN